MPQEGSIDRSNHFLCLTVLTFEVFYFFPFLVCMYVNKLPEFTYFSVGIKILLLNIFPLHSLHFHKRKIFKTKQVSSMQSFYSVELFSVDFCPWIWCFVLWDSLSFKSLFEVMLFYLDSWSWSWKIVCSFPCKFIVNSRFSISPPCSLYLNSCWENLLEKKKKNRLLIHFVLSFNLNIFLLYHFVLCSLITHFAINILSKYYLKFYFSLSWFKYLK